MNDFDKKSSTTNMIYGGTNDNKEDDNEIVPIQITENSEIHLVTKKEAATLVINELNFQKDYFESLSDDEKEQYLSNIVIEHAKKTHNILDSEITECTLNEGVYNLLQIFYVPDKIAKTIASWVAWFIRGLGKITWAFISQSVLYILTHWQRLCILFFIAFVVFEYTSANLVLEHLKDIDIGSGDTSNLDWSDKVFTDFTKTTTGSNLILANQVNQYVAFFIIIGFGFVMFDFLNRLRKTIQNINANCLTSDYKYKPTEYTKEKIRNQLDSALNDLKKSSVIRKGISQSRQLKQNPISNEQFVQHVQSTIDTTPVPQILGTPLTPLTDIYQLDITNPDNVTQDQYNQGIVQYSLGLEKHSDDIHFITTPTPEEPPIVFIGATDDTDPKPDEPLPQPQPIDGVSQTLGESIKFILSTS